MAGVAVSLFLQKKINRPNDVQVENYGRFYSNLSKSFVFFLASHTSSSLHKKCTFLVTENMPCFTSFAMDELGQTSYIFMQLPANETQWNRGGVSNSAVASCDDRASGQQLLSLFL